MLSAKSSKFKQPSTRKTGKIKTEPNFIVIPTRDHQSLNHLIASASNSDNANKRLTLRTFSPEIGAHSGSLLQPKERSKKMERQEEEIIDRLARVLEEYRQSMARERKDKEQLTR
jgi:hypothetical protein